MTRRGSSLSLKYLNNLNQWLIRKSNIHPTTLVQRWSWSECMPFWWWVWQEGHQAPSSKVLEKTLAQNKTSSLPAWMSAWRGMEVFGEESEIFVMCCCSLHLQFVYKECLVCKVLSLKCKAHRDHHLILTPDLHHQRSRPHYLWLERYARGQKSLLSLHNSMCFFAPTAMQNSNTPAVQFVKEI